jgi:hypothetical protein
MQHRPFVLSKNYLMWNLVKEFTDKWQIWSLEDVHKICIRAQTFCCLHLPGLQPLHLQKYQEQKALVINILYFNITKDET